MLITSLSIANTNLIDWDAFAQIGNQTLPPANTNSSGNLLTSTSLSNTSTSKINNNTNVANLCLY